MARLRLLHTALGLLDAEPAVTQDGLSLAVREALDRARPVMQTMAQRTLLGERAPLCLAMGHGGLTCDNVQFRATIDRQRPGHATRRLLPLRARARRDPLRAPRAGVPRR